MPVRELMEKITFTEFLDWSQFLEQEERRRTKLDWYLAQVAAEVRRGTVTKPKTVKVSDFFVSYMEPGTEDRMKRSKFAWGIALKIEALVKEEEE